MKNIFKIIQSYQLDFKIQKPNIHFQVLIKITFFNEKTPPVFILAKLEKPVNKFKLKLYKILFKFSTVLL